MSEKKNQFIFLENLKKETIIFTKFQSIYEKACKEGYLEYVYSIMNDIFEKEIKYVVSGWLKRSFKVEEEEEE